MHVLGQVVTYYVYSLLAMVDFVKKNSFFVLLLFFRFPGSLYCMIIFKQCVPTFWNQLIFSQNMNVLDAVQMI